MYCAILADIVRSRHAEQPGVLQRELENSVALLAHSYGDQLATQPAVVRGDELQILLRATGTVAFDLAYELSDRLHPFRLRFGVGRGRLATPLRSAPGSLSGPVFYRAREAIEEARRRRWHIRFAGFGPYTDTLDVLADCGLAIAASWTAAQRDSVRAFLEHGSHQAAADALGLDRSTVTRNLQRALADRLVRVREQARALLSRIPEAADYKEESD